MIAYVADKPYDHTTTVARTRSVVVSPMRVALSLFAAAAEANNLAWTEGVGDGWLFIADPFNHAIRLVTLNHSNGNTSTVTTLAGGFQQHSPPYSAVASAAGFVDGTGAAARFRVPRGVAVDPSGRVVYVADEENHAVRRVELHGTKEPASVSTLAGGAAGLLDGVGTSARFDGPAAVCLAGEHLFVADARNRAIRSVGIRDGRVRTVITGMREPNSLATMNHVRGWLARRRSPCMVSVDLHVTEVGQTEVASYRATPTLRQEESTAEMTEAAETSEAAKECVPASAHPLLWTWTWMRLGSWSDRHLDTPLMAASSGLLPLHRAVGLAFGASAQELYVADYGNHLVRQMQPGGGAAVLAGDGTAGYLDGAGTHARFAYPRGIAAAITASGCSGPGRCVSDLYVSDSSNHAIRRLSLRDPASTAAQSAVPSPSPAVVTGVAGQIGPGPHECGFTDGTAACARFRLSRDPACPPSPLPSPLSSPPSPLLPPPSPLQPPPPTRDAPADGVPSRPGPGIQGCPEICDSSCRGFSRPEAECSGCDSRVQCHPGAEGYTWQRKAHEQQADPPLPIPPPPPPEYPYQRHTPPSTCFKMEWPRAYVLHGIHRSGTTWLQGLLVNAGAFSRVYAGQHLDDMHPMMHPEVQRQIVRVQEAPHAAQIRLAQGWWSRLVDYAAVAQLDTRICPPKELLQHGGWWADWPQMRARFLQAWRAVSASRPEVTHVGFTCLHSHGIENHYGAYADFVQEASIQPVVLLRVNCLDHFVSVKHPHLNFANETYMLKQMESQPNVTFSVAELADWCQTRNGDYDELRSEVPHPAVLTYEALVRDRDAVVDMLTDLLGITGPRSTFNHEETIKVHRGDIYSYIDNADEVRASRPQQWDYALECRNTDAMCVGATIRA